MTETPRGEAIDERRLERTHMSTEALTMAKELAVSAQALAGTLTAGLLLLFSTIALSLVSGITAEISPYWWSVGVAFVLACGVLTPTALRLSGERLASLGGPRDDRRIRRRAERSRLRASGASPEAELAERRLLKAIERHGELTPARAALESSLSVVEADRMLSDLAKGGYLEVRVEGGKLHYGL